MKEEFGRVEILFPAVEEKRIYSMEHAPVRRVALAEGDRLVTSDDEVLVVCGVEEEEGLLIYQARGAAGGDAGVVGQPVQRPRRRGRPGTRCRGADA